MLKNKKTLINKIKSYLDKIYNTKPTLSLKSAFELVLAGLLAGPMLIAICITSILESEDCTAVLMVVVFGAIGFILFCFGIRGIALMFGG